MRDEEAHHALCDLIESVEGVERNVYSMITGINGKSILTEIPGFKVTKMLSNDSMHDLLEGGVSYEIKIFLRYCIREARFFTLDHLNSLIGINFFFLQKF